MLSLREIKKQTLPHIVELSRWLNLTDEQILDAYKWVYEVIYDYHRVYEPYQSIKRGDVQYFFDLWCDQYFVDPAPAEPHDAWGAPIQEAN
mgnify:FL=1|jgi:hypothetical protein|tara:strand:- start:117 stop:389 length:273 start_codon:yes stop_codon:yes gene_type:complete